MLKFTLYGAYKYDPTLFDGFTLPSGLDKDILINELMDYCGEMYPRHQVPDRLKDSITFWFTRNEPFFKKQIDALLAEYNPLENYDRYEETIDSGSDKSTKTAGQTQNVSRFGKDSTTNSGTDTTTNSGTDTTTNSGKDTTTNSGSDVTVGQQSAYDSATFSDSSKSTVTLGSNTELEHGLTTEMEHGLTTETEHGLKTEMDYASGSMTTNSGSDTDTIEYGKRFTSHVHGNIGVIDNATMVERTINLYGYDIYTSIRERFEKQFLLQIY